MLKLTLVPEEYLTINGNIVLQVTRVAGGRVNLAIDAARDVPIVRGKVLERDGEARPACLAPPSGKKANVRRDKVYLWNDDQERAVKKILPVLNQLEERGLDKEAAVLRKNLNFIIPTFWEGKPSHDEL